GAEELNRHARAADPFAKIGTRTVSVEVISVVRASNRTFAIRWIETAYENGLQIAAEGFSGIIEIVFEPPRTTEALLANPSGIYVHSFASSLRVLTVRGAKPALVQLAPHDLYRSR
ncbi:MAG: VirB8/TrbF family protein, partial [Rhodoplanes sp.]